MAEAKKKSAKPKPAKASPAKKAPASRSAAAAAAFRKVFGKGERYAPFGAADAERLAGRIPDAMRLILEEDGFCAYLDQVFWLCDPDEWDAAGRAWFPDVEKPEVLARTAFGDLFVRDGEVFWYALVHESTAMRVSVNPDAFFSVALTDREFSFHADLPAQVREAREAAGTLKPDEMYTYVPALAAGGSPETSKIERVKAREALVMLAQLAPIDRH